MAEGCKGLATVLQSTDNQRRIVSIDLVYGYFDPLRVGISFTIVT